MGRVATGVIGIGVGAAAFVGMHEVINTDFLAESNADYTENCAKYLGSAAVTIEGLDSHCGIKNFDNQTVTKNDQNSVISIDLPSPKEYLAAHLKNAVDTDNTQHTVNDIENAVLSTGIGGVVYFFVQTTRDSRKQKLGRGSV